MIFLDKTILTPILNRIFFFFKPTKQGADILGVMNGINVQDCEEVVMDDHPKT